MPRFPDGPSVPEKEHARRGLERTSALSAGVTSQVCDDEAGSRPLRHRLEPRRLCTACGPPESNRRRRPGTCVTTSTDTRPSRNIAQFTWTEQRRVRSTFTGLPLDSRVQATRNKCLIHPGVDPGRPSALHRGGQRQGQARERHEEPGRPVRAVRKPDVRAAGRGAEGALPPCGQPRSRRLTEENWPPSCL